MINYKLDSFFSPDMVYFPLKRTLKMNGGKVEMFYPEYLKTRSQDLEPAYHDAGQFYWMRFKTGLKGKNKVGFEIPEIEAQDIDTEGDLKIAKTKYLGFLK